MAKVQPTTLKEATWLLVEAFSVLERSGKEKGVLRVLLTRIGRSGTSAQTSSEVESHMAVMIGPSRRTSGFHCLWR